ncbi:aminopeptidase [Candidatus Pacearchaeota archaeon CG10_big_fil_rev_8_21_14_0_10_34_76]|nr:MAG: aminopeptidase [Candidatus Pacearchaeota archaeon CG10_big_fil_rev_8_21_14_0_10_34_76]
MSEGYKPSDIILERYADVLVNFALNGGKGVKRGEVVLLQVPEIAKPMLIALRRAILKAGANSIIQYLPDDISRDFYELADEKQIEFFPEMHLRGLVNQIDHSIHILADTNMHELEGIESNKIMKRSRAFKPFSDWKRDKENRGEFTWTLALYGTEAMAKEAGMRLEEYWEQIIYACFLDMEDPIQKWKEVFNDIEKVKEKLNNLSIEKLRVKGENIDLVVGIGKNRKWLGGDGRNIPSFEIFISPDSRITEGKISFNKPLYRYGNLIENISLEFKNGKIVRAEASKGGEILKEMVSTEGADMIGEFSLTDARLSRIERFMAETLFDENVGGEFGNMHIAIGSAYKDSYPGNPSDVNEEQWKEMGYNDSAVHTDIVNTEKKEIFAHLSNGEEILVYKDGKFVI